MVLVLIIFTMTILSNYIALPFHAITKITNRPPEMKYIVRKSEQTEL